MTRKDPSCMALREVLPLVFLFLCHPALAAVICTKEPPAIQAPVAVDDAIFPASAPATISILANDIVPAGQSITITAPYDLAPAHGSISLNPTTRAITYTAAGTLVF